MSWPGCFAAIALTAGLLLAGSDGEWFPWANLAGLAVLGCFLLITNFWDERPAPWRQ